MITTSRLLQSGCVGASALLAAATGLGAQDSSTVKVTVKQIAPVEARAAKPIGAVSQLRALPDGGVLINDNAKRQVIRFDSKLSDIRIIADTAAGSQLPYSQRSEGLLAFMGDSSVIVDPSTSALLVLNNQGKLVRVMAAPRNNDINTLSNVNLGSYAFDNKGQLVYRQGNVGGGPNMSAMFGSGNTGRGGNNNSCFVGILHHGLIASQYHACQKGRRHADRRNSGASCTC